MREHIELINEARTDSWWVDVMPEQIEHLRHQLRNLVTFADSQERQLFYTDFRDQLDDIGEVATPMGATGYNYDRYQEKVSAFIRENESHIAIAKIKRNRPLTDNDLAALDTLFFSEGATIIESSDRFKILLKSKTHPPSLAGFIRQVVGLEHEAVRKAFERYLDGSCFSANQIRFVEQIIDWLTENGTLPIQKLYEPPFTNQAPDGLDDIFTEQDASAICAIAKQFNVA